MIATPQKTRAVATFLGRLHALDKGSDPAHADFVAEDAKVIALLAARGLTEAERKRLDALVKARARPHRRPRSPAHRDNDERLAKLAELKGGHEEWPPPRAPC